MGSRHADRATTLPGMTIKAFAALPLILTLAAAPASAAARPPENPACRPLAATIEHWLPTIGNRADDLKAAYAVDDYVNPVTLHWLNRWVGEVGGSFYGYSVGDDFSRPMRDGLTHIRLLCPSLPARRG